MAQPEVAVSLLMRDLFPKTALIEEAEEACVQMLSNQLRHLATQPAWFVICKVLDGFENLNMQTKLQILLATFGLHLTSRLLLDGKIALRSHD